MEQQEYIEQYVSYRPVLARRGCAALVDYFHYFVIVMIYGYLLGTVNQWGRTETGFSFSVNPGVIAPIVLWLVYFPFMESKFGYTLGKGLFDLKLVCQQRKDYPFIVSLKRHLLDPIDFSFFGLVAILLVKNTKEHQRLGDMWAHSLVVKETTQVESSQPPADNTANNDARNVSA